MINVLKLVQDSINKNNQDGKYGLPCSSKLENLGNSSDEIHLLSPMA